jgi:hypothetical protein
VNTVVGTPSPRTTPSRVVCAKQADAGLDHLLTALLNARIAMQAELSTRPPEMQRQVVVRHELLHSLEAYTTGLLARGLSAPPSLRDELALQRSLDSHRYPSPLRGL